MPSELEHCDKWEHNRSLLPKIETRYSDWRATVAFYAALHAVEAFLAKAGRHCYSHEERDPVVQREMSSVYRDYYNLYSASRIARYMVHRGQNHPVFSRFMTAHKVQEELIRTRLQRLEAFIIRELALPPEKFPDLFPPQTDAASNQPPPKQ